MVAGVFILLIKRRKRMTLNIDQESCIKCGKCVRVCPSDIFTQERAGETIGLVRVESCIVCGHCVDVCPTGSVLHSEFPPEKTHTIDYSQMPTPEQVMLLIKSRRSNRTLTSRPVPKEMLDKIVEAAHSAPTATNSQSLSFTVVTGVKAGTTKVICTVGDVKCETIVRVTDKKS